MKTFKYYAASLLAVLFLSSTAQAQDDGPNTKGQAGDIGVAFNYDFTPNVNLGGLGGLLGGGGGAAPATGNQFRNDAFGNAQIMGRYYLSDGIALRLGLGISQNSSTSISQDSSWGMAETGFEDQDENSWGIDGGDSIPYSKSETNTSRFSISFAPGIEKHISTDNSLDPYVGLQIPIAILGSQSRDSSITKSGYQMDPSSSFEMREVGYEYSDSRTTPGGFGIGVQALLGFNWFVADKISIGMEYSLGFMNVSTGGLVEGEVGTRTASSNLGGVSGELSNTRNTTIWNHQTENTNSSIQTMSSGGINVSIFF